MMRRYSKNIKRLQVYVDTLDTCDYHYHAIGNEDVESSILSRSTILSV